MRGSKEAMNRSQNGGMVKKGSVPRPKKAMVRFQKGGMVEKRVGP